MGKTAFVSLETMHVSQRFPLKRVHAVGACIDMGKRGGRLHHGVGPPVEQGKAGEGRGGDVTYLLKSLINLLRAGVDMVTVG